MAEFRPAQGVLLDKTIPIVHVSKKDPEKSIRAAIAETPKGRWSHAQVAIPKKGLKLEELGFESTRLAIPLPGEKWFTPSYRAGELHAHDAGPFYLVHRDASAPNSLKGVLHHAVVDVPGALARRFFASDEPFVKEEKMDKKATAALFDELVKVGAISDEQAQNALNRYETLERNKPTLRQVARYGAIGAGAGLGLGALGDVISGKPVFGGGGVKSMARGALAKATVGALGSGAVPLIRSHFDREAEKATLRRYLQERAHGVDAQGAPQTGGKLAEPFVPVEKSASPSGIAHRVGRVARAVASEIDDRVTTNIAANVAADTARKALEKDSGTGITPAQSWDGNSPVDFAKFGSLSNNNSVPGSRKKISEVLWKAVTEGLSGPEPVKDEDKNKEAAGAVTRGGFAMASGIPAFRAPQLRSPVQHQPQQIVEKLGGAVTPAGRLSEAKRVGTPRVSPPPGPSVAQVAKPVGFGRPMPGALKNSI